jgi:hypothetical protein
MILGATPNICAVAGRVRHGAGGDQTLFLPPKAAAALEVLLGHLLRGERVAVLAEDQELSPNDIASIPFIPSTSA